MRAGGRPGKASRQRGGWHACLKSGLRYRNKGLHHEREHDDRDRYVDQMRVTSRRIAFSMR